MNRKAFLTILGTASTLLVLSVMFALAGQTQQQPGRPQARQHQRSAACLLMMRSAKREVTNIANGVRVQITSEDQAIVKRIQANAAAHQEAMKQPGPRHMQRCPAAVEGANVKVTSLTNGAELEITADKPEAVKEIQARAARIAGSPTPRSTATKKAG